MLSALFYGMVDGLKQYFLNLFAPENINRRLEPPPARRDSFQLPPKEETSSHSRKEANESLDSSKSKMKIKNRLNRWSFMTHTANGFRNDNNLLPCRTKDVVSRSSSCLAHSTEVESMELSYRSTQSRDLLTDIYGHRFSPIPLDTDTFCDFCNKPIYGFGYESVCQRCSGCHMTCHWICRGQVRVYCRDSSSGHSVTNVKTNLDENEPTPMLAFEETIRPGIEELSIEKDIEKLPYHTLSTIESSEGQTLSIHSVSAADLCQTRIGDALGTLHASQLASSSMLADQVAHISLVKKREVDVLTQPNKLHKCNQQLPGQDYLLPEKNDRRASDVSLFAGDQKCRIKNQNANDTMYFTASSELSSRVPETDEKLAELSGASANGVSAFFTPETSPSKPSLVRHDTDLGQRRRPKKTNLAMRHSFLAGHGSDASIYSRLAYDFSSLDKEAIRTYGIRVRQVTANVTPSDKPPGLPISPKHPPLPPQRKSSLLRPQGTDASASPDANSKKVELGYASVMQNTEAFVKSKPKYGKHTVISPVTPVPLTSMIVGPRGRLPYSVDELTDRVSVFNMNEFGLQARLVKGLTEGDCEGQVRIHMNLLRPIRMLLRPRPVSIFDIVGKENEADEDDTHDFSWELNTDDNSTKNARVYSRENGPKSAVTSNATAFSSDLEVPFLRQADGKGLQEERRSKSSVFWVPRGSTKVLHVQLSTTAQKVISTLLDRFHIEDNPQKFALYEHTIEGEQEVSVRKLFDDESPLGLLLRWTEKGPGQFNELLGVKRLVLQENETGDIEWSGFSLPELTVFLGILNQEEADYRRRIEMKFEVRRKEILRLMTLREKEKVTENEDTLSTVCTTLVREAPDGDVDEQYLSMPRGASDSLSTPASPLLRARTDAIESDAESITTECPSPSSPTHVRTPGAASTLPRVFGMEDRFKSTLFKPSKYKQSKKAERAQQKRLAKLERERAKAEKKRLKAEAKLAQQTIGSHGRKWLTGISSVFPSTSTHSSDNRSTLNS